ncbi:unnamed protein product [Owenia fusiformis]|uniref:Uncharacterized protein n=1 Tax=Owenia fusiformis TaxID=6347 RepID=A0A8J1UMQ1_OWEFU|nr:unnamed protein product [Owenia fusiformis]
MKLFLVLGLCLGVGAIPRGLFYPYGPSSNDTALEQSDDTSSNEIHLETEIVFFDDVHSSIFVNLNGHLSFETELPGYNADFQFPMPYKVIAGFLSDIDTTLSGDVYFREETDDRSALRRASEEVGKHFPSFSEFTASSLFIATWEDVGRYNQNFEEINTFQIIIATDGTNSFATFIYPEDGISWLKGDGKALPIEDPPAQAGFDSGDGRTYTLPGSGTDQVINYVKWTNVNVPGVWMFQIGDTFGGNIGQPEETDGK